MANIWKEQQGVKNHPNRNNFDLSFQNHLSMKLGTLYPIMCKQVVPGDSFSIDTAFGLKFMPMVFPVQSKMMAYVHYFYVRNKNLWENWENFISGLEEHTHPYISQPPEFFNTGTLSDYLNVPSTIHRLSGGKSTSGVSGFNLSSALVAGTRSQGAINGDRVFIGLEPIPINNMPTLNDYGTTLFGFYERYSELPPAGLYLYTFELEHILNNPSRQVFGLQSTHAYTAGSDVANVTICAWSYNELPNRDFNTVWEWSNHVTENTYGSATLVAHCPGKLVANSSDGTALNFEPTDLVNDYGPFLRNIEQRQLQGKHIMIGFAFQYTYVNEVNTSIFPLPGTIGNKNQTFLPSASLYYTKQVDEVSDSDYYPWDENQDELHLSALPYRAYESIYNAYYRNTQNQPFYVNGVQVYNKYNTTLADGADTTDYHLYQRNYELDFLTSAMPSPQFGNAPLVGINAIQGDIELEDDSYIKYTADLDGQGAISKLAFTSADGQVVAEADIPKLGFTINDFRGANALQHFLEMTLRHGYKYRDFIEGHFGSAPKDQELDMPEFIGGVSQQVVVNQITNMAKTNANALGEIGGTAACFGASKHSVRHYCDDYGWIMGIMCVVPEPAYSQILPKHFLCDSQLDYFFPEFSQLGLQPITYKEVCPLQVYVDGGADLTDTFGYQRPNYDMVSSLNEVHGEFRKSLHNFLFNRIFVGAPQLGTDFLEIKPDELNDVFVYDKASEDTIIGQVVLDIKAKRPVPRVNVPGLGR